MPLSEYIIILDNEAFIFFGVDTVEKLAAQIQNNIFLVNLDKMKLIKEHFISHLSHLRFHLYYFSYPLSATASFTAFLYFYP